MTMASPTATSAAAIVMLNTPQICPVRWCHFAEKATKLMLAALRISSIDIRMMTTLRRMSTPRMPMATSARLRIMRWLWGMAIGSQSPESSPGTAQHDGSDHGHQQEHRDDLEGKHVIAEQRQAHRLEVSLRLP